MNIANDTIELIKNSDPELAGFMQEELDRQRGNIELIASENIVSPTVLAAAGSILTNKYAEGYPGHRYYGGCEKVDLIESLCIERACKLYGAAYANVQPHSGSQANYAIYHALLKQGDRVLGMALDQGGHLTHGSKVNFSGKNYEVTSYGLCPETGRIDYDALRRIAKETQPAMIIAGASAYPRIIDFKAFREVADEVGAYLMVDMAHIAGLVAAGEHPSPMPYADIVTTTTHKTLRGPRGGMILTNNEELSKKINKAIFPGTQGGPLVHIIAAKAAALGEALTPEFKAYQHQVVLNSKAMAKSLLDNGIKLVSNGTDNHLSLIDLTGTNVTGKELETNLDIVHITANKNAIPADPLGPSITSGLRIGSPAVTSRGFDEADMHEVGELIALTIKDFAANKSSIEERVAALTKKHPIYE